MSNTSRWQCESCLTVNGDAAFQCYICDGARPVCQGVQATKCNQAPTGFIVIDDDDDIHDSPAKGPCIPQSSQVVSCSDDDSIVIVPKTAARSVKSSPAAIRRRPQASTTAALPPSQLEADIDAELPRKKKRGDNLEQNRGVAHALQRAAVGKLSTFETAVCVRQAVLDSEAGKNLIPALAAANYALLPPPAIACDPQRANVITWHHLVLNVDAIAQAAAAKTTGTIAAASSAAAHIDMQRAVSSAAAGVAGSALAEPFAAVIWSGSDYLKALVTEGTDGFEAFVSRIRAGVAKGGSADLGHRCQITFIVEGLSGALASVDQRSTTARYVTSEAVEHAHMHLYLHCGLEVAETSGPVETAEHLMTMTKAIAEKPYNQRTSAFAHVLKRRTRAATYAAGGSTEHISADAAFLESAFTDTNVHGGVGGDSTALDTWLCALQMVPSVSEAKAVRVASVYPTFRSLQRAFLTADHASAPRLLEVSGMVTYTCHVFIFNFLSMQDLFDASGRRKHTKLSTVFHTCLTQKAPDESATEDVV